MALKIKTFELWFHYEAPNDSLVVDYLPIAEPEERLEMYKTQLRLTASEIPEPLHAKLQRLADYVRSRLEVPEIEISGSSLTARPVLWYYQVQRTLPIPVPRVTAAYYATPTSRTPVESRLDDLSEATRRLIENIFPMCERLAWDHLHARFAPSGVSPPVKKKVLLSYRRGSDERQRFVTSIADRLGREGFLPWYDEWEIKAGDSIARELSEGLKGVYAIVVVITSDYPGERWAREELEVTISKRIEEGVRVIPMLYEQCTVPELLRPLRYVNCTVHHRDQIEKQFGDLIDALNEIELNPYR